MFDSLQDRLAGIFDKLSRRGALSEADVTAALREVRRALIEADVALDVVKDFIETVRERAVGVEVVKSVTPGQMVVKIVNDALVDMLGKDAEPLSLAATPPVPILMVGLQGSGKTTSTAKIARRLTERDKQKVLMASLDTRRPAAMEQLKVLGEQINVDVLPIVEGQSAQQISARAMQTAKLSGYDVVMLDTAGRTTLDEELMAEVATIKASTNPHEVLLVADALTGQDAVNTARAFNERLEITGIVLTRVDGDGRGGAALSMRAVTGKPIKLMGVGEKWDALEDFHPERIASRILGMGDIVSLVEKAAADIDQEKAAAMARKMQKGAFDLDDLSDQLRQMQKMGGMTGMMGMLPGVGKVKKQIDASGMDDSVFNRQMAIISSMTRQERKKPDVIKGSRRKRIAAGSGTEVQEVNRLLKMHRQMADMMKKMGRRKGGLAGLFGGGAAPDPAMLEDMAKAGGAPGAMPPGLPPNLGGIAGGGLPNFGGKPGGLPGLPGGLPGLGGGKKK